MKSEQLHQVREACKEKLLDALMTLVRENGDDYDDYYRDEHGIDEDEGYTVTKVFDIACFGCHNRRDGSFVTPSADVTKEPSLCYMIMI